MYACIHNIYTNDNGYICACICLIILLQEPNDYRRECDNNIIIEQSAGDVLSLITYYTRIHTPAQYYIGSLEDHAFTSTKGQIYEQIRGQRRDGIRFVPVFHPNRRCGARDENEIRNQFRTSPVLSSKHNTFTRNKKGLLSFSGHSVNVHLLTSFVCSVLFCFSHLFCAYILECPFAHRYIKYCSTVRSSYICIRDYTYLGAHARMLAGKQLDSLSFLKQ